jgi:hypothetical protein
MILVVAGVPTRGTRNNSWCLLLIVLLKCFRWIDLVQYVLALLFRWFWIRLSLIVYFVASQSTINRFTKSLLVIVSYSASYWLVFITIWFITKLAFSQSFFQYLQNLDRSLFLFDVIIVQKVYGHQEIGFFILIVTWDGHLCIALTCCYYVGSGSYNRLIRVL